MGTEFSLIYSKFLNNSFKNLAALPINVSMVIVVLVSIILNSWLVYSLMLLIECNVIPNDHHSSDNNKNIIDNGGNGFHEYYSSQYYHGSCSSNSNSNNIINPSTIFSDDDDNIDGNSSS